MSVVLSWIFDAPEYPFFHVKCWPSQNADETEYYHRKGGMSQNRQHYPEASHATEYMRPMTDENEPNNNTGTTCVAPIPDSASMDSASAEPTFWAGPIADSASVDSAEPIPTHEYPTNPVVPPTYRTKDDPSMDGHPITEEINEYNDDTGSAMAAPIPGPEPMVNVLAASSNEDSPSDDRASCTSNVSVECAISRNSESC